MCSSTFPMTLTETCHILQPIGYANYITHLGDLNLILHSKN